jgi:hypothetical protein
MSSNILDSGSSKSRNILMFGWWMEDAVVEDVVDEDDDGIDFSGFHRACFKISFALRLVSVDALLPARTENRKPKIGVTGGGDGCVEVDEGGGELMRTAFES